MKKISFLLLGVIVVIVASANLEALPDFASNWPDPFQRMFLRVFLWQWVVLAALFVICYVAGQIGKFVAKRLTVLRDKVVPQPMSEHTRSSVSRWAGLLVGSMLALTLLPSLNLNETVNMVKGHPVNAFSDHAAVLVNALICLATTMLCFSYWDATCDTIASKAAGFERAERLLVPMMRKFVGAIILLVGGVVGLGILFGTKTLTGLVAGLGVTGLVVALAGKDSVENIFGSLTILFDMPFSLGDYVKIDKVEGNVEEINLRSTRIRTTEDTLITLPNANLIRASVENYGARRMRRQKVTIRLNYASDPDAITTFCTSLWNFLNELPEVEKSKTIVQLDEPTEASIAVVAIWFIHVKSPIAEAESRSKLLKEALRQKNMKGLYFITLPTAPDQDGFRTVLNEVR